MTDKIIVWNDPSEMDHVTQKTYFDLGGFRDDVDWICYVPHERRTPCFCWDVDGSFYVENGIFYVKTHS